MLLGFLTKDGKALLQSKRKFPPLCPDFVIELLSESDSLWQTQKKMEEWMANGCKLAWLIDPFQRKVFIYKASQKCESTKTLKLVSTGKMFFLDLNYR